MAIGRVISRKHRAVGQERAEGNLCQAPAMRNGRCKLHGGKSTGPRTQEGIERIRKAVTKHGRYSQGYKAEELRYRRLLKECRETLDKVAHRKGPRCPSETRWSRGGPRLGESRY